MGAPLESAGQQVREVLFRLAALFVPGVKLTFVMRNPALPDGTLLVTEDDEIEIEAALRRLRGAPEPIMAPPARHPQWREGYVDAGCQLRATWERHHAAFPSPAYTASQVRVDEALATLCRECGIDPIHLVDRLLTEQPDGRGRIPDGHLGGHKLMGALAIVGPQLDPTLAAAASGLDAIIEVGEPHVCGADPDDVCPDCSSAGA